MLREGVVRTKVRGVSSSSPAGLAMKAEITAATVYVIGPPLKVRTHAHLQSSKAKGDMSAVQQQTPRLSGCLRVLKEMMRFAPHFDHWVTVCLHKQSIRNHYLV